VIQRARLESGSHACELEQFENVGPLFVHGRTSPIHVWKLQTRSSELLPNSGTDIAPRAGNQSARP
jgi:hypothetical protein